MENQDFVKLLEDMGTAGMFYNDANLAAVGHPYLDEVGAVLAAEAAHLIGEGGHVVGGFLCNYRTTFAEKSPDRGGRG